MSGSSDEFTGKLKQAVGDITDNPGLRREGKVDEAAGKLKGLIDKVKAMFHRRRR
jgi:uncharacterized protein YjbJ (UPF0337 family)